MPKQKLRRSLWMLAGTVSTAACASPIPRTADSGAAHQSAAAATGDTMADQRPSISERFANLDEYLLWLRKFEAPADGAWYKEIRPGVYELQTGGNLRLDVPATGKRIFTREELEKRFGFSK